MLPRLAEGRSVDLNWDVLGMRATGIVNLADPGPVSAAPAVGTSFEIGRVGIRPCPLLVEFALPGTLSLSERSPLDIVFTGNDPKRRRIETAEAK
jgi:hypothetical protein